jgi:hypothetical protein
MANSVPQGKNQQDLSKNRNFFCKLSIGGIDINPMMIGSIVVREWVFDILPRLELTLSDDGTLFEVFNLKDQTLIHVELSKTDSMVGGIVADFTLDNWSVDTITGNSQYIFTINALLETKNNSFFYPVKTRSFKKKTSIAALEQIGNEAGMKVVKAPQISSQDSMTWLQININNFDMIKHIRKRANVNNDALLTYVSVDNKFHITSIKNESEKDKSIVARFDLKNASADVFKNAADEKIIWFNGYKLDNIQGYYNKNTGYGLEYTYYDLKNNKKKNTGTPYHPFTKHHDQDDKNNVDSVNFGMLTDNVFDNYITAQINNKFLRSITFGQRLALSINSIYDVKLMDKVSVILPSIIKKDEINAIYSGNYLVCGVIYSATSEGMFKKEISLHRNGYNDSSFKVKKNDK